MHKSFRAERPIVIRKRLIAKCSAVRSGYLTINSAMSGKFRVQASAWIRTSSNLKVELLTLRALHPRFACRRGRRRSRPAHDHRSPNQTTQPPRAATHQTRHHDAERKNQGQQNVVDQKRAATQRKGRAVAHAGMRLRARDGFGAGRPCSLLSWDHWGLHFGFLIYDLRLLPGWLTARDVIHAHPGYSNLE